MTQTTLLTTRGTVVLRSYINENEYTAALESDGRRWQPITLRPDAFDVDRRDLPRGF